MTDLQQMIVEREEQQIPVSTCQKIRSLLPHFATGCMLLQQIVILTLFVYMYVELINVKTQLQPTLNLLQRTNMSRINESINDAAYFVQYAKAEFVPEYLKLKPTLKNIPTFINKTENFILQIDSIVRSYLPHTTIVQE